MKPLSFNKKMISRMEAGMKWQTRRIITGNLRWAPGDILYVREKRYMQKIAARIFLQVVSVRIQALIEISEADVQAEGVEWLISPQNGLKTYLYGKTGTCTNPTYAFGHLWEEIHGPGSFFGNQETMVAVIEFKIIAKPKI